MNARSVLCLVLGGQHADVIDELGQAGWNVRIAEDLAGAQRLLKRHGMRVGLLLGTLRDEQLCARIDRFLRAHAGAEWVGAFDAASLALPHCRDLIVDHLFDHHTLPLDARHLALTLGHAFGHAELRRDVDGEGSASGSSPIVGDSEAARELLRQTRRIARVDAPVLIRGESGSGKELTAQQIHKCSRRARGPFIAVNCGAIQPTLIQSELFGHEKGAFTGADRTKRGLIEDASEGTLFLDEIGDLSLPLQINLLRFLQERTICRVGSSHNIPVDVRVIAATNVNLEEAIAAGSFREDLFYRLNVIPLYVPPLRERKSDIELLANHFFAKFADEKSPQVKGFSHAALAAMQGHDWPGNVRELVNRVRRAMVMAEGRLITPEDLAFQAPPVHWEGLDDARAKAERTAVYNVLQEAGSNVTLAAKRLGVSRMTMYRLMAKLGIAA